MEKTLLRLSTPNTKKTVIQLVKDYDVQKLAEIGVYSGGLLNVVIKNARHQIREYWAVDAWKVVTQGRLRTLSQKSWERLYRGVCSLMISHPQLRILRMSSHEAARIFPDKYLDMVYIDANHSYECVLQDIKEWRPKVRSGGIISGHDYHTEFPGVRQSVHELVGQENLIHIPLKCNVWATIK